MPFSGRNLSPIFAPYTTLLPLLNVSLAEEEIPSSPRMFGNEKMDILLFAFLLIMLILVSGLFSCMVNSIAKQNGKRIGERGKRNSRLGLINQEELAKMCRCYSETATKEDILY